MAKPMTPEAITEILKVIIPVLLAAGTGGLALWRTLQAEERHKRERSSEWDAERSRIRHEADDAAWQRVQDTMAQDHDTITELRATVDGLKVRIAALEGKLDAARDRIEELENGQ